MPVGVGTSASVARVADEAACSLYPNVVNELIRGSRNESLQLPEAERKQHRTLPDHTFWCVIFTAAVLAFYV